MIRIPRKDDDGATMIEYLKAITNIYDKWFMSTGMLHALGWLRIGLALSIYNELNLPIIVSTYTRLNNISTDR